MHEELRAVGVKSIVIQSDHFYNDETDATKKELGLDALHAAIQALQGGERFEGYESHPVLIVEGLQTIDDEVVGQSPDFRVFVSRDVRTRIAGRLVRDQDSGFRSIQDNLQLLVNVVTLKPEVLEKFEGDMDMSAVNLVVENDYEDESASKLEIEGNELVFVSHDQTLGSVRVSDVQIEKLKQFGIV